MYRMMTIVSNTVLNAYLEVAKRVYLKCFQRTHTHGNYVR